MNYSEDSTWALLVLSLLGVINVILTVCLWMHLTQVLVSSYQANCNAICGRLSMLCQVVQATADKVRASCSREGMCQPTDNGPEIGSPDREHKSGDFGCVDKAAATRTEPPTASTESIQIALAPGNRLIVTNTPPGGVVL